MNEPLVSVIILNYNGLEDLKECLDSVSDLNYKNIELIYMYSNESYNFLVIAWI